MRADGDTMAPGGRRGPLHGGSVAGVRAAGNVGGGDVGEERVFQGGVGQFAHVAIEVDGHVGGVSIMALECRVLCATISGVNRKDLQFLARTRLVEARTLLKAGLPDGAYYLAGYAVECALKACIARATRRYEFPDKKSVDAGHTHNLRELIKVANLELARLEEARKYPDFRNRWDLVQKWSEQSRYRRQDPDMAEALLAAIDDRKHGVLVWIKRHW